MSILSAMMLLILVMDPLGNIPFYIITLENVAKERRMKVIIRELLISLAFLLVFLFCGHYLIALLKISPQAMKTAGGIVLFLIAIKMVFPTPGEASALREDINEEPFIVPLAIPYVAGPSTLTTLILLMSQEPERWLSWLIAMTMAWFFTGIILLASPILAQLLGKKGLLAVERLMGMLLVALASGMILEGISKFMKSNL